MIIKTIALDAGFRTLLNGIIFRKRHRAKTKIFLENIQFTPMQLDQDSDVSRSGSFINLC